MFKMENQKYFIACYVGFYVESLSKQNNLELTVKPIFSL